jgi:hypothetical protein
MIRVALPFLAAAMAAQAWADRIACRSRSRRIPQSAPQGVGSPLRGASPKIVHSSLYLHLPEPIYEALRETAFHERCKIHDLVMEGISLALRKRGYPAVEDLKARKKR